MKSRSYLVGLQISALAALMALSHESYAQRIVRFDVPASSGFFTRTTGVNALGQVVGSYEDPDGHSNGFVRSASGAFITFYAPRTGDFQQSLGTRPQAINDAGEIVGYVISAEGPASITRGFVRDEYGVLTVFDAVPGAFEAIPEVINAEGTSGGTYFDPDFIMHGFLRSPEGTITTFDGLGRFGQFLGIRSNGEVDGLILHDHVFQGFVRNPSGTFLTFDVPDVDRAIRGVGCPDCTGTLPTAATPSGRMVGYYGAVGIGVRGFLREPDGVFSKFAVPKASATMPKVINLHGAIAGEYLDAANVAHGFLLPRNGAYESFDLTDSYALTVTGIDRDNRVSGFFQDANGFHGFIRYPRTACSHRR